MDYPLHASQQYIKGLCAEYSQPANSYRGELLSMLAIHLFLLAIGERYIVSWKIDQVFCYILGAIYTFQQRSQRVTSGAKNADVQRVLRQIQARMTSSLDAKHVRAHQDDQRRRSALHRSAVKLVMR